MFNNNKAVVDEIMKGITDRDYRSVEKIIATHVDSLSSNVDLKRELSEVIETRSSPTFVDLKGKTVSLTTKYVDELETSFPDLIRVNEKNYLYFCPVVISPALISIFP